MDGDAIDRLAEQLRSDPVVIESSMGSGRTSEYDDRLTAIVEQLPFDAYVALVREPSGLGSEYPSADLADLLHKRIGKPGVYVVAVDSSFPQQRAFGIDADNTLFSLQVGANHDVVTRLSGRALGYGRQSPPDVVWAEIALLTAEAMPPGGPTYESAYEASLAEDQFDDLVTRSVEVLKAEDFDNDRPPERELWDAQVDPSRTTFVGALLGSGVFLLLGTALTARDVRRRRRAKGEPDHGPDPVATQKRRAQAQVDELAGALERLTWEGLADPDAAERALAARDAAEPLLDSSALEDLVGATALARVGLNDLARAQDREGADLRLCFFDPRHGQATDEASWRLGSGAATVPVCPRCRTALSRGERPHWLRVGRKPYFEGDDIWARTGFGALTTTFARDVIADRGERS